LQAAALKKIDEVQRLEDKITKLSIENAKLQATIDDLKHKPAIHSHTETKLSGTLPFGNIEQEELRHKEASQDIDVSISQLKSMFSKNHKQ
jgi:hypothetical protein